MRCSPYAVVGAFLFCFTTATGFAQSVTPQEELRAYVGMNGRIPLPDAGAFGEHIHPLTGELKLVQTDAWLNTNSFPLSVTRSFTPGGSPGGMPRAAFADWQLELPRITTLTVRDGEGHGWRVAGSHPYARCSAFGAPPVQSMVELTTKGRGLIGIDPIRPPAPTYTGSAFSADAIDPNVWWQGYQLIVPGQGEQEMLQRDASNTLAPKDSPARFPLVTAQQWQVGCLEQTDNGEPGEAFVAIAPDGTTYTFNHLVYQAAPGLNLGQLGTVARERASMLVTRIEDRFGNAQQFVYEGDRLVTVINPGEMQLDLVYRQDVPTLVDHVVLRPFVESPRTWSYHYGNLGTGRETLTGVTRPDGMEWRYNLQTLAEAKLTYISSGSCTKLMPEAGTTYTGSLSDPNGLTESLSIKGVRHGRSQVANDCAVSTDVPWRPSQYDTLSLIQRSYSGANIGTPTWTYRYADAATSPAWMDIIDPDQRVTRFTFSNAADESEGRLVSLDTDRHADGSASRRIHFDYAAANAGPYPASLGAAAGSRVNQAALASLAPLAKQMLVQDGDSYTTEWKAFNAFAQPTQVRRGNSIAGQPTLETRIDYLNDIPHWTLGLTQSVTNATDNTVVSQNIYDLTQVTLKEVYRFGLKQASYTYDTQGHVASVTDGNGFATQYQNYVMGRPVTTLYPDGTKEENWPDNFGNIATHMDRAGVTTTAQYDSMDRVLRRSGPQGDDVAWNDTTYRYTFVNDSEWGVPAGHWNVLEDRGSGAQTYTFYDALMRPIWQAAADGRTWTTQRHDYDWRGRLRFTAYPVRDMQAMDALTQGVHIDVDALGRSVASHQDSEQGVLTTTLSYLGGAGTQLTDPKGAVTTLHYQVLDAPSTASLLRIDAPEGITQTISRDVYGLPLTLTQSGSYENAQVSLMRYLVYDEHKRICRMWSPEAGSTVFDYDAGSREAWRAQLNIPGDVCGREQVADTAKIQRNYDAMDRVTVIHYPDAVSQFTYDAMGRVTSADTGLSRWTYAYNKLGLPSSETLVVDGLPYTLGYRYDANGSLASTTYPDGRTVDHAPDAWGRHTQAGSYANGARYLPSGGLEYFKYGNGIEYFAEQNVRSLPRNLSYVLPSGQLLFSQDFSYDPNGNLTQANDLLQDSPSQRNFQYDTLNRLTRATLPGATNSESYSYDPLNNLRRIVNDNGLVRDYTYDPANRLSQAVGSDGQTHSFDYDWRGNTTRRDATPFTFDFANRLTEVSDRESYVYDAFGRRVLKTRLGVGGNKTYYVYSNQTGQLMLQRDNDAGSSETDYIYLGGMLVAQATTRKHDMPGAISFTPGSPSNGAYTIAWGRSDGAAAYELEEQHDGGDWRQIYRGNDTSYAIPDTSPRIGGTYLYRIRACATACSGWVMSSPMGVTPEWATVQVPQGIQKGPYSITWSTPYSAAVYDIDERQVPPVGEDYPWNRIASDWGSNTIERPANPGTYQYRVAARNGYGDRGPSYSEPVTVEIDSSPSGPPITPTLLSPENGGEYYGVQFPFTMHVAWTPVDRVTRYEVRSELGGFSCSTADTHCDFQLTFSGRYVGYVRACNDEGCSPEADFWIAVYKTGIDALSNTIDSSLPGKAVKSSQKAGQP